MTDIKVLMMSAVSVGSSLIMTGQTVLNFTIAIMTVVYLFLRIRSLTRKSKQD